MRRKVSKKEIIMLSAFVILIFFIIWTFRVRPVETKKMEVEFSVGSTAGIIVDTDKVYFGRVVPGGSSQRTIRIENGYSFPIKVKVSASKEIASYIYLEGEYVAEPGEITKIPLTLKIPETLSYGNYTGEMKFDLIKA
jgi:hypothetical protein